MKTWHTPVYVELRMDAEIGSYQDDFSDERPLFIEGEAPSTDPAGTASARAD